LSSLLFDLEINLSARDSVPLSDTMVGAKISTSLLLVVVRLIGTYPRPGGPLQSNKQKVRIRSLAWSPFGHRHHLGSILKDRD
jgi:hypothetical protein